MENQYARGLCMNGLNDRHVMLIVWRFLRNDWRDERFDGVNICILLDLKSSPPCDNLIILIFIIIDAMLCTF